MLVSDFDYTLPEDLIAQQPLADRAASRMLHLNRASGNLGDRAFRDLPELLRPSDLLVVNNSKVFAARLYGRRAGVAAHPISPRNPAAKDFLRGRIEVLLTTPVTPEQRAKPGTGPLLWQALVRPGRKINVGERLYFGEHGQLQAEVVARGKFGERTLQFSVPDSEHASTADFFAILESLGHTPLPPYIARPDSAADRERYQTVYARHPGSAAAPTAGLHFTTEILDGLHSRGIEIAEITLHVGLGTFQPVRVAEVEDHQMHRERFTISPEAAQQINRALADKRRVVAVGTTAVRTLEFCAAQNAKEGRTGEISAGDGEADLFIFPGYKFRVTGALLTNFHLPQSTLLMLVSAFAGRDAVLAAYRHAVSQRYRFFSYGDCMFIE